MATPFGFLERRCACSGAAPSLFFPPFPRDEHELSVPVDEVLAANGLQLCDDAEGAVREPGASAGGGGGRRRQPKPRSDGGPESGRRVAVGADGADGQRGRVPRRHP